MTYRPHILRASRKWKKRFLLILLLLGVAGMFFPGWKRYAIYWYYEAEEAVLAHFVHYDNLDTGIPGPADRIINRKGYALGFSEKYRQSLWVAYRLTKEEVTTRAASRTDNFREDPRILTASPTPENYKKSGFDRGHLAPAADMAWSSSAMSDSFFISNMVPQNPGFNRGIWKNLEIAVRENAREKGELIIVTGPVFWKNPPDRFLGGSKIAIPDACYKVLYSPKDQSMIGFIIPNKASSKPLKNFTVTVDDVEKATGLNFFSEISEPEQSKMEACISIKNWNLAATPSGK